MTIPLDAALGRLGAPPSPAPFDEIRLVMLDTLLVERRSSAGHAPWHLAWDRTATLMRDTVLGDARAALRAAAEHSRYPSRRLAALDPDDETAEILRNRLLAAGMALERFENEPGDPDTDRRRGAALEQSWDGAVQVATADAARWRSIAAEVASWRRPMRPFWLVLTAAIGVTAVGAAWLGGQLDAPAWFAPVRDWWWGLPWP